jgi:uncharacterized OsmC-like protein
LINKIINYYKYEITILKRKRSPQRTFRIITSGNVLTERRKEKKKRFLHKNVIKYCNIILFLKGWKAFAATERI